jgi:hypothetical protein
LLRDLDLRGPGRRAGRVLEVDRVGQDRGGVDEVRAPVRRGTKDGVGIKGFWVRESPGLVGRVKR